MSQANFTTTSATLCNTLQLIATHCATLQQEWDHTHMRQTPTSQLRLQQIATHCNSLQHTAPHFNRNEITRTYITRQHQHNVCNTSQHTATHCNTLHHNATGERSHTLTSHANLPHCNRNEITHTYVKRQLHNCVYNKLQHTATHCNTLHHTATGMRSHTHTSNANFTTTPPRVREALSSQTSPGSVFISLTPLCLVCGAYYECLHHSLDQPFCLNHPPPPPGFRGFTVTK